MIKLGQTDHKGNKSAQPEAKKSYIETLKKKVSILDD